MRNRSNALHSALLKHKWMWLSVLCLLLLLLSACGNNNNEPANEAGGETTEGSVQEAETPEDPNEVVATYDLGEVTRGDLNTFLGVNLFFNSSDPYYLQYMNSNPNYEKEMLDQYISLNLLAEEADESMREEASKMREAQIGSMDNATDEQKAQFENVLEQLKITLEDLGDYFETRQLAFDVLNNRVDDTLIQEEFDRQKTEDEHSFITATVSHILITINNPQTGEAVRTKEEALKLAEEVKQKLDSGEDFAALAAEYSEDEGSKQNGGTYEDAQITAWVPGFKEAAATLPLNEVSEPVETQFGYHVMKVTDRETQTLEDVKEQLRAQLTSNLFVEYVKTEAPNRIQEIKLPEVKAEG
jgi:foldase protein PrsA